MKKLIGIIVLSLCVGLMFGQSKQDSILAETKINLLAEKFKKSKSDLDQILKEGKWEELSNHFNYSINSYVKEYKNTRLRTFWSDYLIDLSNEMVNQNHVVLLVYGRDADSIAAGRNNSTNSLKLEVDQKFKVKLISIADCNEMEKQTVPELIDPWRESLNISSRAGNKFNFEYHPCQTKLENLIKLTLIGKFNENTLLKLEEKYDINEVLMGLYH